MSNPLTGKNYGVKEQEFGGGPGLFMIQMGLGGSAGPNSFPADFYIEDEGHTLKEAGFGGVWTPTTRSVGDAGKVIDVWQAPFLPPHVILKPRRAKKYYVEGEGKAYTFPWFLEKQLCLHPTLGYQLPGASGVETSFALQLLIVLADFPELEPFFLTLPGKGAKKMFFDNNLNDKQWGNQELPWGVSPTLNHTCVQASEYCKAKAEEDPDGWGSTVNIDFTQYSMWIGVAIPTEENGNPAIVQFGRAKKSPINPVEYIVLPTSQPVEDIFEYCLLSAAHEELNNRVGELREFAEEWADEWGTEKLLAQNVAAQAASNAAVATGQTEEEDDLPF